MFPKIKILFFNNSVKLFNNKNVKHLMSYKQIPGPKGLPFVGNVFDIKPYGIIYILYIISLFH